MIVADSSTLILLAKLELLDKFIAAYKPCSISPAVYEECTGKRGAFDALLIEKKVKDAMISVEIPKERAVRELAGSFNLGEGEAQSLALAIERKSPVATDDGKAIRAARIFSLPFVTALSFIVSLAGWGEIQRSEAKEVIRRLEKVGRYRKEIIEEAFKEVEHGEGHDHEDG